MEDYQQIEEGPCFKDKKAGLVIFGVIQIILGALSAMGAVSTVFGMIILMFAKVPVERSVNPRMFIAGAMFYAAASAAFIWMGIGSIMARRWARALTLVGSWLWLIGGTIGLVVFLLFVPNMYEQMAERGQIPEGAVIVMRFVMTIFLAVVYVVIPAVFVLFYGSRSVRATCKVRDPKIRWTDKCPLPVLAVSVLFAFWLFSMPYMGIYNWAIPFFGVILTGAQGAVVALAFMVLCGYTSWAIYKLDIKGWWCSVLLTLVWIISGVITFSQMSLIDYYEKMNFPQEVLEIMRGSAIDKGSVALWPFVIMVVCLPGYLIYERKYFVNAAKRDNSPLNSLCER